MTKINLSTLEKILEKVGYSPKQIEQFRQKFWEVFSQKIGQQFYSELSAEQKEEIEKIFANKQSTLADLKNYLDKLNISQEVKEITQKTFAKMVENVLDDMVRLASDKQYALIKQELFGSA